MDHTLKVKNLVPERRQYDSLMIWTSYKKATNHSGYYMSAVPVQEIQMPDGTKLQSFVLGTGTQTLVKAAGRRSAKAEQEAESIVNCAMNGIAITTLEAEQELHRELVMSLCDAMDHRASAAEMSDIRKRLTISIARTDIMDVMHRNHLEFE